MASVLLNGVLCLAWIVGISPVFGETGNVPLIGHCQDTPSVQLSLTGLIHGRFEIDDRAIPEWYFTCMESSKTMGMYRILISDAEEIISDNGTTYCQYHFKVTYINNGTPHTNQLNLYLGDHLIWFSPVLLPAPSLHLRQEGEYLVVSGNFSAGWSDADVTISCEDCVTVNLNLTGTTNQLWVPLDELRIDGRFTVAVKVKNKCEEVWENTTEIVFLDPRGLDENGSGVKVKVSMASEILAPLFSLLFSLFISIILYI